MKKLYLLFALAWLGTCDLQGQLTVQGGLTAQQLAENLAGPGLTVTNASITGANIAYGTFSANGTNLGVSSGVILTTGNRNLSIGPNNSPDVGADNFRPGTPQMDAIAGTQTFDAVTLQFDFQVESSFIQFNYVFGSEEYPEFAPPNQGTFNDVFAFFISGPGINGQENIALVPNTNVTVGIDNINPVTYWQYYVDNDNGTTIQYDGFTQLLQARRDNLTPCETYTLTLMIADAGDGILDSGVFLEENSLIQGGISAVTNTINGDSVALEGCTQASFTFNLDSTFNTPVHIPLGIGGTALNGVDYDYIDSVITIPPGQQSATIIVDAFADGIAEGQEYVELYFYPEPCADPDTVVLYIDDNSSINFSANVIDAACNGDSTGEIQLNINGGNSPYTVILNETDTFQTTNITGLPAGTYVIDVDDAYGCGGEALVIGGIDNGGPVFIPDGGGQSYSSTINLQGFPAGATLTSPSMIQSVCLDLEHSFMGELEIKLTAPGGQEIILKPRPGGNNCNLGEPEANGPVDTNNPDTTQGVCYTYCFNANPTYGTMVSEAGNYTYTYVTVGGSIQSDKYLPAGSYESHQPLSNLVGTPLNGNWTVSVRDYNPNDNGWICQWSISIGTDNAGDTVVIEQPPAIVLGGTVNNASCNGSNGSIDLTVNAVNNPFTYAWSNGATTQDISGLGAGSYTVTVTDANLCSNDTTFLVQNNGGATLSHTTTLVSCPGGTTGGVDLTVTGGAGGNTYAWSNGATTQDLTAVAAGSYTVTVTDAAGCQSLETVLVTEIPGMVISDSLNNETCGNENGNINLDLSGGTAPYTYSWSTGETTEDIAFLEAGSYSVTITDANGCTRVRNFTLINEVGNCFVPCDLSIDNEVLTNETCGNAGGAIDLTVSTSYPPMNYQWSTGATTQDLTGLTAGTYTVTVEDAANCQVIMTYTLQNQTGNLQVTGTQTTNEFCANGQGAINITVSGGAMPYSYSWSNGATTEDLTGLHAGTYTVTITDGNGCSLVHSASMINDAGTLTQTYGNAVGETCGNGQGSIDIIITGGASPYTYAWSNGATTEDLMNISAGNYTCTITDQNGCQLITPTYQVPNNAGSLSIFDVDVYNETCGNGLGEVRIDVTGGVAPLSYAWSNGATTEDIGGLSAGSYTVTVTDANGCSVSSGPHTVNDLPGTLSLDNVQVQDAFCGNGQGAVNITVSGGSTPYSFLWSTGSTSEDLIGLSAGTYTCTITDAAGCQVTATGTVNNNTGNLSISNMVVTNETCGNATGAINLVVAGGNAPLSYAWSNGATTEDLSGLQAGSYTVTVTDANGCSQSGSATITNLSGSLSVTGAAVTNEICSAANGSIDLSVSGLDLPFTYAWSNGGTLQDLNSVSAGTYTCTITDNAGCVVIAGPYTIQNSPGTLSLGNATVTDEICGDGMGAVDIVVNTGNPPYSFIWSNGATTEDISMVSAGSYTVTVTDGNGCDLSATYQVSNDPGTLVLGGAQITDENCGNNQGAIDLTVSGGQAPLTYSWSNGAGVQDPSGLAAGSYSVTVTDANGCEILAGPYTVTNQAGTLSVDQVLASSEVCGGSNGSISLVVSGGALPITYSWSNGDVTKDISGLSSGLYTCTVTDNNGCQQLVNASVLNDPGSLSVLGDSIVDETCGAGDGEIYVDLAGAIGPMTFLWSNGAVTQDILGLNAGTYTLNVTDSVGCALTYSTTVTNLGANLAVTNASVSDEQCGNVSGAIDITVGGGQAPYTYAWTNGATTEDITGLSQGSYTVTVTDANGCTHVSAYTVGNAGGTLAATTLAVTDDNCGTGAGAIDIAVANGNPPYTFAWSNGATTEDISGLQAGTYTVTVTDGNGCTDVLVHTVANNANGFAITGAQVSPEICGNQQGAVDISVTGGNGPYTYLWSNGATTEDLVNVPSGTYTVTVTDNNGCVILSGNYVVNNNTGTLASSHQITDEQCGDGQGAIDLSVTGGQVPYTFLWSTGATTEDVNLLSSGSYTVTITDGNGCQRISSFAVGNGQGDLTIDHVTVTPEICSNGQGSIDMSASSTNTPLTFAWSNGATTEDVFMLVSGTYSVTITDANGCVVADTFQIGTTGAITLANLQVQDDFCSFGSGVIDIQVTGGDGNYQYSLNGGPSQASGFFGQLLPGTYLVQVTDGQGCVFTQSVVVGNQSFFQVNLVQLVNASCQACPDGSIDIDVQGQGPYTYLWSTGATTQDVTNLVPGTYIVTVTEGGFCSEQDTFVITGPTGIVEDAGPVWQVYPNPNNGNFQVDFELGQLARTQVRVYNMMGQPVYDQELGEVESGSLRIQTNNLPDGNYVVVLRSGEEVLTKTVRIVR